MHRPRILPYATPAMDPVLPEERIVTLDILRGFAILAILLVNMGVYGSPVYPVTDEVAEPGGILDDAVARLIRFLAEGKFYPGFPM